MARSTPSLLALLGIAAVAGYQNRDKLGEMLGGASRDGSAGGGLGGMGQGQAGAGGLGGLLGSLGGGGLTGGLSELMERFGSAGHRDRAESWVGHGENQPVPAQDLASALGEETLDDLTRTTGLTRSEVLERLAQNLPETVDRLTPDGRVPTEDEARRLL